jgi:hypothetical protein
VPSAERSRGQESRRCGSIAVRMNAMLYSLLAWITVAAHASFILFVVFGGVVVWRFRWVALLHVPAAAWGAYVEFSGRACPLTPIENKFRALAGLAGYREDFVEHYLLLMIYPEGLTEHIQYALGILVLALNTGIYLALWHRARRSTRSR